MADYNSDRTGSNIDSTLDKVDALDAKVQPTATGVSVTGGADISGTVDANQATLKAIAQTKAETAVDVFVYDTSKDSDGGAWRQRTQGTSWYNETLNTSTRGSRKEFPAVAVITIEYNANSENNHVMTIYDGDDPTLPMWMKFKRGGGVGPGVPRKMIPGVSDVTSVSALNGLVCLTSSEVNRGGVHTVSFIDDSGFHYSGHEFSGTNNSSIANRDVSYPSVINNTLGNLVDTIVNDVAMTVLPNAPIDPATGLPIPTIAVATNGGVSVIKDDGTVVDITGYVYRPRFVIFDEDSQLYSTGNYWDKFVVGEIPDSDILVTALGATYNWTDLATKNGAFMYNFVTTDKKQVASNTTNSLYSLIRADVSAGTTEGLLSNITTSTYNTGWMNGDIKLATLSDTDDTDLVGSELVTNGTFDTDTSGWTAESGATLSATNSALNISPTVAYKGASQDVSVEAGKTYCVQWDVKRPTTSNFQFNAMFSGQAIIWNDGVTSSSSINDAEIIGAFKTFTRYWTATATGVLTLRPNPSSTISEDVIFDNISVRLAEADRSVNNNGLQVFGTVTREPVATGADLVAYSGFSDTNYLMQPYNSDLDFGTGDFCVMAWVNANNSQTGGYLFDFATDSGGSRSYCIFSNTVIQTSNGTLHTSTPYTSNTWTLVGLKRKDGVLSGIVNDNEYVVRANSTGSFGCIASDVKLHLSRYTKTGTFNNMALYRISGTAPTAEQIAKIYRDEKVLFQEGAQATLHGTSDAVTALAYDTDTELLHVGSSAGRSVFQGLQRVDNTTDAVGVAISASNGLVTEE